MCRKASAGGVPWKKLPVRLLDTFVQPKGANIKSTRNFNRYRFNAADCGSAYVVQ